MNILVFNWSDIKNPNSGGAEVLTHEIAKRWVSLGHTVSQFCSYFPGAKKRENIDGVSLMREGSPIIRDPHIPVHVAAYRWYKRHGQGRFDIVIDEIHGIPFFTPLYVKEKKLALICEVANELWDVTFPFPFNIIGKAVERIYFRLYKNVSFLTISSSTKEDLMRKGVPKDHITILPMGLTIPDGIKEYPKEKNPTLLFVGRLAKTKGTDALLDVLEKVRRSRPSVKLWIVGRGDDWYVKKLKKTVSQRHLRDRVEIFGFVPERKKFELMARAHILVVPSVKEGWGLIVPEAALVGTPAVAYNVRGLRDVIIHKENGFLVAPTPQALGDGVLALLNDERLYSKLQKGAKLSAKKYSWDKTADTALNQLREVRP